MLPIILAIRDENDRLLVERIYETYEKHMYMIALGILHNRQDAEDAVNNTVIKIIDYIEKFVDISREETKRLIVIYTRSVAIDMYRSKRKRENIFTPSEDDELEREFKSDEPEPDDVVISEETILTVQHAVEKLDVKYRDVIILKYYHDMRDSQVADLLGISETAVSSRLSRARQILKEEGKEVLYELLKR